MASDLKKIKEKAAYNSTVKGLPIYSAEYIYILLLYRQSLGLYTECKWNGLESQ
jgi:hypothetical protein